MTLKIITGPTTEPVTLDEAKAHCRVDGTDEDELITALIVAARQYCEQRQNRAYLTQTLELTLDRWPSFPVDIPHPPLVSVESIKYYGTNDKEYIWATTEYFVDTDSEPGRVALNYAKTKPTVTLRPANGVKIRYTAGGSDVAQTVKQAMLLLIGHWYINREAVLTGTISKEIEFAVAALLNIDRVWPT
ncbi:MAG: hypothetical protein H6Q73_917 [Firmicutes bacterium]|nr:hypothetical protein [Bacillota bacterium]